MTHAPVAPPDEIEPLARRDATGESHARLLGAVCGAVTLAFLSLALDRSYDLDSSVTVGAFVETPSITDVFTKWYLLNNHVFLSFLEHLVYSVTGSTSEPTMHALPIGFSALAVGVLAWELGRRFNLLAGLCGAALLATNPLFADVGTEVRGYSLLVSCGIVATIAILPTVLDDPRQPSAARRIFYVVVAAVGVATHLYMLWILVGHVLLVATRPARLRAWLIPWLAAGTLGAVAYAWIGTHMLDTGRELGRVFRPGFPIDAGEALLGGSALLALLVGALVVVALWRSGHDRRVQAAVVAVVLPVVTMWLLAPYDLYPRFFVWLTPAIAVAVAASVAYRPVLAVVVLVAVALQLGTAIPLLTEDPFANRTTNDIFERVRRAGGLPCTADDFTSLRMLGYSFNFSIATTLDEMRQCTVVATVGEARGSLPSRNANREFAYRTKLDARRSGVLWSRAPGSCWLTDHPPASCPAP